MKKDNINHLLQTLYISNDWMTSQELALQLHTTERSVRNYVREINNKYPKTPIVSGRKGYHFSGDESILYQSNSINKVIDSPEERIWFMIRELAYRDGLTNNKSISMDEMADKLSLSLSSLSRDIDALRRFLTTFNIRLSIKDNVLSLRGNELNKRNLIYECIAHYADDRYIALKNIQASFPQYSIKDLNDLIESSIDSFKLSKDCVHYHGLLMNIIIQIERLKGKHTIQIDEIQIPSLSKRKEYTLACEISTKLGMTFGIKYGCGDIDYLTILFISCLYDKEAISDACTDIGKHLTNQLAVLSRRENIDFNNPTLFNTLYDLLERIKIRSLYRINITNPLTSSIRNSLPIVFDEVAWIFTDYIKLWKVSISRDDIADFAIVISQYIRTHKTKNSSVNCLLVCPDCHDQHIFLKNKLQSHYGERIVLDVCNDKDEVSKYQKVDMILSTIHIPRNNRLVQISPSLTDKDYSAIRSKIEQIENKRRIKNFYMYLKCYSSAELFERNHDFSSREEVLTYITDRLEAKKYGSDLLEDILLREKSDSTCFHNMIAVPHISKKTVNHNCIYIILNDEPIKWHNRKANLVVFIAMERNLMDDMRQFYNTLINLFNSPKNMEILLNCSTYDEFIDAVVTKIDVMS